MNHIRTPQDAFQVIQSDVRNFRALLHSIHPLRALEKAEVVFYDHFPTLLAGFGITLGGIIASWILYRLILWFGLPLRSQPHFRVARDAKGRKRAEQHDPQTGKVTWKDIEGQFIGAEDVEENVADTRPIYYNNRSSIVHFLALFLLIVCIILAFYTGFWVAGFSFFNLAMSLGVIGILVTYSFSAPISNTTAAFIMFGTGLWTEGMAIALSRDNTPGIIMQMGIFYTVIKLRSAQGRLILRTVPNRFFMDDIVDRYVEDEEGMQGFDATDIDRKINRAISSGYDPTFTQHLRNRRTIVKE